MGIQIFFWSTAIPDPAWQIKTWLEHFLMAAKVKENYNPELLLEDPKEVPEEPTTRPEARERERERERERDGENTAGLAGMKFKNIIELN